MKPLTDEERWAAAASGALDLEERLAATRAPAERRQLAREYLVTLQELFPRSPDPVDHFESFTLQRLVRALLLALEGDDASTPH